LFNILAFAKAKTTTFSIQGANYYRFRYLYLNFYGFLKNNTICITKFDELNLYHFMPSYTLTDWETDDEPYTLIGIHATIEPYRMAYKINKHLKTEFSRMSRDQDVVMPDYVSNYPVYYYTDSIENTTIYLTPNRFTGKLKSLSSSLGLFEDQQVQEIKTVLLKEYQSVDFLLKIEKDEQAFPLKKWLNNLIEIPQVISAYTLDRFKIKNQDYLIFE